MILLTSVLAASIVHFVCLFDFIHLFILILLDLTSILNKVKSFPGVTGYVIVDKDCNIVHTSLEGNEAITLAAIVIKV